MNQSAKILSVRNVYEGWSKFMVCDVRLPDGAEVTRQIEAHGDAVAVLPYDPERRTLILISLFRAPVFYAGGGERSVEAIAGLIDPGESLETAAKREALEESGLELKNLEPVTTAWASPGISTEKITLYLAAHTAKDRIQAGGGLAAEHENITVLEIPVSQAWRMLESGEIGDMKTVALILALRVRRPDLFDAPER